MVVAALVALVVVALLTAVAVGGRGRFRSGHGNRPGTQPYRRAPGPAPDLRPEPAGKGYYAPTYSVFPGRCFRLCREPGTGTAYPCDQAVVGTGEFEDPRGNVVIVEACRSHRGDLTGWRQYSGGADDPAPGGVTGIRTVAEDPGGQL